ncbi:MAG: hypothetical protein R3360_07435, partial [Alphaproteobacteria bacterium]|nr:hypothetical protein [Alphaproteobacteria bacterium]
KQKVRASLRKNRTVRTRQRDLTQQFDGDEDPALEDAARGYITHPRGVRIDSEGEITASKIYSWYMEDFGGTEAGVIAHVRPYASDEVAGRLKGRQTIDDFEYDWSLNLWTGSSPEKESGE